VGPNLLVYVDTLAPAPGFASSDLQAFSQYLDQTLYSIVTGGFGPPTDVDQNGRVIMLLSPVVNAISAAADCSTQGFIAGFFAPGDFTNTANSNQGEVFYSIVPDPNGTVSCAHSVAGVGAAVPATFMHEMQHLIDYSQHVVVRGTAPESSWLDEGLSIVAEELGSVYFEQKCPPPSCRTNPAQLFPDSAQGFVQSFLYDSYQYGLLPDTASLTLNTDDTFGFEWRGGDWLLMRWLGDQFGSGVFLQLVQGPADGVSDIVAATGQSFQTLFGNFGVALVTDSLPGALDGAGGQSLRVPEPAGPLGATVHHVRWRHRHPLRIPGSALPHHIRYVGGHHESGNHVVLPARYAGHRGDRHDPVRRAGRRGTCHGPPPAARILQTPRRTVRRSHALLG
jgi:hypothetical protein